MQVAKNPFFPTFNHYLVESIAAICKIGIVDENSASAIEQILMPVLQMILQNDVEDLIPYVFQLIGTLVQVLI